jgi:peptidyl-prolyl cis-trans isomerase SurA
MKKNYIKEVMGGLLKMIKKKIFICTVSIFFIINTICASMENRILVKIENEIISSIDVNNEIKYLTTLNKSIQNLNKKEIFIIAKKSIIREKIKKIEILKNFENPKIPEKYLEQILQNVYKTIEIENLNSFKNYLKINNIDYEYVKDKIQTEALWNELVVLKYSSKIMIDEKEIRQKIIENTNKTSKSYLLSEISFQISNSDELANYYKKIKEEIKQKGFDNTALKYSTSNTSSVGGKLGWIDEESLNENLKNILSEMKKNDFTDPIIVPGGFLILKIDEIKKIKKNKNIDQEIKKIVSIKKNNQLNQFSKLHFNKAKKNIQINEL